MQSKNIVRIVMGVALILLLPLLATQVTDEVVWSLADFIIAGVLLFGAGITYEFLVMKKKDLVFRVIVGIAVVAVLLLIWMELAVGIF